jgi:hypothetical protein
VGEIGEWKVGESVVRWAGYCGGESGEMRWLGREKLL